MSKSLNLKGIFKVEIKVRKDGLDSGLVLLKLGENLSNIRQELEKDSLINDTLLFAKGTSEIQRRSEREFLLNEIIKEIGDDKFINLKKNSKLGYDLKVLKDELKLEYGRKINSDGKIEIAEKNAFRLNEKDFKVNKEKEIGIEKKEVSSSENNKSITELTLNGDISAHGFAKFGLSYGKSKNTIVGSEKKSFCNYTYVNKISLKFKSDKKICFEPTEEFKDEIENAIKIKDHREKLKKFKDIIEKFGQFISNEVLIGGRAYSLGEEKSGKFSEEKNKNGSTTAEAMSSSAGITHTSGKSTETSYYSNNGCFILIGGKSDNPNNFDESAWVKSLDDFNNWACIEYKNPVSIFKLLPDDLYKDVFKSIGKRILYNDPGEDYTYNPNEKKKFELKNIPPNIADIIQKEDSECNIFATVIDTVDSKNDFFNCQILKTPDKTTPQLMIHCIQKNTRNTEYKLKIGLIIVGYDVNFNFINSDNYVQIKVIENDIKASSMECKKLFDDSYTEESICLGIPVLRKFDPSLVIGHHFYNYQKSGIGAYTFSYSLKENHYVKLPEFTFHMLIISNYPDCNEYKIIPFNCKNSFFDKLLSLKNSVLLPNDDDPHSSQSVIPKYISLHSSEDNCAPIFLKQKQNEIKIKCMKREVCENATCICKKTLKFSDLTFHYFKTQHENNWKILRA